MRLAFGKICVIVLSSIVSVGLLSSGAVAQGKLRSSIMGAYNIEPARTVEPGQKIMIKTREDSLTTREGIFIEAKDGLIHMERGGEIRLDSLTMTNGTVHIFSNGGAVYNPETKLVTGTINSGGEVTIPLAEIDHIHVTLTDEQGSMSTQFSAEMLRKRLKFNVSYPEVYFIPVDSISALFAWSDAKGKSTMGAIGAVSGLAIGYFLGLAQYEAQKDDFISYPVGVFVVPMAVLGTIGGAWLFSSFVPDEGWKRVPITNINFGIVPTVNGSPGVAVAVRIPL